MAIRQAVIFGATLIGMGMSDKPDIAYRFSDHSAYFEGFMKALNLQNASLVLHDWGGAVGLDFAARNPNRVRAIAFMEALMRPMLSADANAIERYIFDQFRGDETGRKLLIEQNYFIERALNMFAGRSLTEAELTQYREPFLDPAHRQPIAQWPREIPIDGSPKDNAERMQQNYNWLRDSNVPTLLLTATPGAIVKEAMVQSLQADMPRMDVLSIGPSIHYVQETAPQRISAALNSWLSTLA